MEERRLLVAAARDGFFVVGVAGVGGHPVVGVGGGGAGAVGGFVFVVGGHVDGAVPSFPTRRSSDLALVVIELEGDRAADVFAEGAGQGGLVLEGRADDARGRVLGGFDRGDRKSDG